MKKSPDWIDNTDFEKSYLQSDSFEWIAGVDEAGRGPLAGPVSIGLSIFDRNFVFNDIPADLKFMNDSKKIKETQRNQLGRAVAENAAFSCCLHISSKTVDRIHINGAIELGIHYALLRAQRAGFRNGMVLIDGNYHFPDLYKKHPTLAFQSIIKGDQKVFCIASASNIAKSSRDKRMLRFDRLYPGYALDSHKGYGTKKHIDAIRNLGQSPIHRKSYKINGVAFQ